MAGSPPDQVLLPELESPDGLPFSAAQIPLPEWRAIATRILLNGVERV
jgi:hypothetical protein